MKDLKNLNGAKILSKMDQMAIKGGLACYPDGSCPTGKYCCPNGLCQLIGKDCYPI